MQSSPIAAAETASAAFPDWAALGPNSRRELLNRAADELGRRADRFVETMAQELRASEPWSRFNVMLGS